MKAFVEHHGKKRIARGFTCAEVLDANLTLDDIKHLNIPLDSRRKTKYKFNIDFLKNLKK